MTISLKGNNIELEKNLFPLRVDHILDILLDFRKLPIMYVYYTSLYARFEKVGGGGYTGLHLSVIPSVRPSFRPSVLP